MQAEREASQFYSKTSKQTKDPRGKDMLQQLSEFEMSHLQQIEGVGGIASGERGMGDLCGNILEK